jgi:hypothetical protein
MKWIRADELFPPAKYVRLVIDGVNYLCFGEFGGIGHPDGVYDSTPSIARGPLDDDDYSPLDFISSGGGASEWVTLTNCIDGKPVECQNLTAFREKPECVCSWSGVSVTDGKPSTAFSTNVGLASAPVELLMKFSDGNPTNVIRWFIDRINDKGYGPVMTASIETSTTGTGPDADWLVVLPMVQLGVPSNLNRTVNIFDQQWSRNDRLVTRKIDFGDRWEQLGLFHHQKNVGASAEEALQRDAGISTDRIQTWAEELDPVTGSWHIKLGAGVKFDCDSWVSVWSRVAFESDVSWARRIYDMMLGGCTTDACRTGQRVAQVAKTLTGTNLLSMDLTKRTCADPCEYFHPGGGIENTPVPGCTCTLGRSFGASCDNVFDTINSTSAWNWHLVFRQQVEGGSYLDEEGWFSLMQPFDSDHSVPGNTHQNSEGKNTSGEGNYHILDKLEKFRSGNTDRLTFKIQWPGLGSNNYNTWQQKSNPVQVRATDTLVPIEYQAIDVNWIPKLWGGLEYNSQEGKTTVFDGSVDSDYAFYAIGSTRAVDLNQDPDPVDGKILGPGVLVDASELYALAPAPQEAFLYLPANLNGSHVSFDYRLEYGYLSLEGKEAGSDEWVTLWSASSAETARRWSEGWCELSGAECGTKGTAAVELRTMYAPMMLRLNPHTLHTMNSPTAIWTDPLLDPTPPTTLKYMEPKISIDNIDVTPMCAPAPLEHGTVMYDSATPSVFSYSCDPGYVLSGPNERECTNTAEPVGTYAAADRFLDTQSDRPKFIRLRVMASNTLGGLFAEFEVFETNRATPIPLIVVSVRESLNVSTTTAGSKYTPNGNTIDGDSSTCYGGASGHPLDMNDVEIVYEINATTAPVIKSFDILMTRICHYAFNAQVELGHSADGPWVVSQPWEALHPAAQGSAQMRTTMMNKAARAVISEQKVRSVSWAPVANPVCECEVLTSAPPAPALVKIVNLDDSVKVHFTAPPTVGKGCAAFRLHAFDVASGSSSPLVLPEIVQNASSPLTITGLTPGSTYRFGLTTVVGGSESELSQLSSAVDIKCAVGEFQTPDGACTNCAAGRYNAGTSQACPQCPVGKHTANREAVWKLVYRQTATADTSTYPTKEEWLAPVGINKNNESAEVFSKLGFLEGFRAGDGNFTFKLVWPEMAHPNYNMWMQSSNPADTNDGQTLTGYRAIEVRHDLAWGGLVYSGEKLQANRMTTLDGTGASSYFFGVGFTEKYMPPPGISGGTLAATGPEDDFQPIVELWARIDYLGAVGAETSMSSFAVYGGVNRIGDRVTHAPGYPEHAIDRQLSQYPDHNGAIQSLCVLGCGEIAKLDKGAEKSWWRIDLATPTPITAIALTNIHTYAELDRTTPPMNVRGGLSVATMADCAVGITVADSATVTTECVMTAQFLEVYHPDSYRIMQLAEVTIFGGFGDEGHSACTPCPYGYTTAAAGADSVVGCILECTAGSYGEVGDFYEGTLCHSCPAGRFSMQGQFDECTECPAGYFQPQVGFAQCTPCNAEKGLFSCGTGATVCANPPPQACPGACNQNSFELFCEVTKYSDGTCNPECNYAECDYDGGDCDEALCDVSTVVVAGSTYGLAPDSTKVGQVGKCFAKMIGDGRCDDACNTASCNMDGGDCCERRNGELQLAFNLSFHEKAGSITKLLPDKNSPKKRLLGTRNVVVAGVMLRQKRMQKGECLASGKAAELGTACLSETQVSREPYGYDPVFLTASSMYDEYLDERKDTYYDVSDSALVRNGTGNPYGFHSIELKSAKNGDMSKGVFPVVFDVNLGQSAAIQRLTYLREGYYLDDHSKQVDMRMLIYSAVNDLYAYVRFDFIFEDSGLIRLKQSVSIFSTRFPFYGSRIWLVVFLLLLIGIDIVNEHE